MSEAASTELLYDGPARFVGDLAQLLEEEGLQVRYRPPMETRGIGDDVHTIVISVMASGGAAALGAGVKAAAAKFRQRFPGARVRGKHVAP